MRYVSDLTERNGMKFGFEATHRSYYEHEAGRLIVSLMECLSFNVHAYSHARWYPRQSLS